MELAMTQQMDRSDAMTAQDSAWHLYAVGALALGWSVLGAARFLVVQFGLHSGSAISSELALLAEMPIWAGAFWAITIWGSLAGSAFLLLRSKWAVQALTVSVIGFLGISAQLFIISETPANIYAMPIALASWIIAIVTTLYALRANATGLLR